MTEQDPNLEEARARIEQLTKTLARRFSVDAAARLIFGAGVGLVLGSAGRGPCIDFLRELLDQVENEHPEDSGPAV